jgi:putative ABC transport system substrate-binding protein
MKRTSLPLRRREFVALLGVAATWPLAARAQQASKTRRLGYLAPASIPHLIEALRSGLRELGYVEGQNLAIEYRFALGQSKTYDELAVELIRLDPDAIVVVGTPPALAAKRQTTIIPIVMAPAADPLRLRLVASLARPGGNLTGVSLYGSELARKRMEVFREAVAGIRRIGVLVNAENPLHRFLWDDIQQTGSALGLRVGVPFIRRFGPQQTPGDVLNRDAGRFRCPGRPLRCAVQLGATADYSTRRDAPAPNDV